MSSHDAQPKELPGAATVASELRRRLAGALHPDRLEITDESALHAGHAGASPQGETHFRLLIQAPSFTGLGRVARQRLVYEAAGDLMATRIHALAMRTLAPDEG